MFKMDQDSYSKFATALLDLNNPNTGDPLQNQDSLNYMNKSFVGNPKPEFVPIPNDDLVSTPSMPVFYPMNVPVSLNNEQVPMDDYDPLETFTFWDGETFYCSQDQETGCCISPGISAENEMAELQDYLMQDEAMGRDDFAQIENSDLLHNPTLAELNCGGDTVFDCSAENSFLSDDSGYLLSPELLSKSMPLNESSFMNSATSTFISGNSIFSSNMNRAGSSFHEPKNSCSPSILSSSCPIPTKMVMFPQYVNPTDERFLLCPQNSPASDSFMQRSDHRLPLNVPPRSPYPGKHLPASPALSISVPSDSMASTSTPSPVIKIESPGPSSSSAPKSAEKTLSGFSSLSLSNDDESGSFFDSDHDDDFSSDDDLYQYDESDEALASSWPPHKDTKGHRKNRFFWQYNLQSRGIKTQNLLPLTEEADPHVLNDVKDPVFSEDCTLPVKHSGKARKGDGNDLTPNPKKLYSIGSELKKLNKLIYNLNPANEFGSHSRSLSRKEKNKLASRVCRLKKKAQHEANKIKLYGLQQEHKKLLNILGDLKSLVKYRIHHLDDVSTKSCAQKVDEYMLLNDPINVAGDTTGFVNEVLEKIAKGEPDGGLGKL